MHCGGRSQRAQQCKPTEMKYWTAGTLRYVYIIKLMLTLTLHHSDAEKTLTDRLITPLVQQICEKIVGLVVKAPKLAQIMLNIHELI